MTATTEHSPAKSEPTGSNTEATEPAPPDDQGDEEHQDEGATGSLAGYLLLIA
ncbi:hypothetical protein ACF073_20780 [Streptomyces sp. NPDC015171]|uniref:hypothetical protein n=1 Tax=Streptomyces sp. NPDC015171 TaxID=3364945 RepID=UPI0036F98856